ncbi:MAG TPA: LysR family transcriptional regulator [Streptosporangiaceae bacterium]|nr:LysR family transcriptional regulator [Streptosporangiaceae bacterium]
MIDLRRLQVLRAVHHHGMVTSAAAALHLTPSAVSQQIRQLSRDVGVPLLEPHGRRVRLTVAAHVLLDHADALYDRWEAAKAELAAHVEGAAGPLRLCGFPSGVVGLLAPAAARLAKTQPDLSVSVTEAEAADCFDRLLTDQADLAVVIPTPDSPAADDPRFDQTPLVDEAQDLLVPAGHPLATREAVRLAEAAGDPWITPEPGTCDQHHVVVSACIAAGFTPHVAHRATEWPAVSALVAHGLGVALIPRLAALPAEHTVVRVPLHGNPTPTRRILTCTRRGARRHPVIAAGLDALAEIAAMEPGVIEVRPGRR